MRNLWIEDLEEENQLEEVDSTQMDERVSAQLEPVKGKEISDEQPHDGLILGLEKEVLEIDMMAMESILASDNGAGVTGLTKKKKNTKGNAVLKEISSKKRLVQACISPRKKNGTKKEIQIGDRLYLGKLRKATGTHRGSLPPKPDID